MCAPEPIFETVNEDVLETHKTRAGFVIKKVEYTVQCTVEGMKFVGKSMIKKEAKQKAAALAWEVLKDD